MTSFDANTELILMNFSTHFINNNTNCAIFFCMQRVVFRYEILGFSHRTASHKLIFQFRALNAKIESASAFTRRINLCNINKFKLEWMWHENQQQAHITTKSCLFGINNIYRSSAKKIYNKNNSHKLGSSPNNTTLTENWFQRMLILTHILFHAFQCIRLSSRQNAVVFSRWFMHLFERYFSF